MFRFVILLGLLSSQVFASFSRPQPDLVSSTPSWVVPVEAAAPSPSLIDGGAQICLYDRQINVITGETYYHWVIKLENADAVGSYSDISQSYDPSYQQLHFHSLKLHRQGKSIDVLSRHQINQYQRESSMERSLYDSSLTAVINVEDVRPGDILEYSYSYRGFNPAFASHFYSHQRLQLSVPVGHFFYRVLKAREDDMDYLLMAGAPDPEEKISINRTQWIWDLQNTSTTKTYSDAPFSYDPVPRVAVTNYHSWAQVAEGTRAMYRYTPAEKQQLREYLEKMNLSGSEDQQLTSITRFVQDDIRYLGFENGLHAFKPHSPLQVLQQRYGDCKDKSHLLVGLFRAKGYQAWPVLINTYERGGINGKEISPYNFDHCTVLLQWEGKQVFIDPTLANQGGSISAYSYPDYSRGLVLRKGENELLKIPDHTSGSEYIRDILKVKERKETSIYEVYTRYSGSAADNIRSYLLGNSAKDITDEYEGYYRNIYPHIRSAAEISINDDRTANSITTVEKYLIDSLWTSDGNGMISFGISSQQLQDLVNHTYDPTRKAPVSLKYPYTFHHTFMVNLPEEWPLEPEEINIEADEYRYNYKRTITQNGKSFSITHTYETLADSVPIDHYKTYSDDHQLINEQTGYIISDFDTSSSAASNAKPVILALLLLVGAIAAVLAFMLMRRLHKTYDPEPAPWAKGNKSIGGWLVLPAIGLCVTPLVYLITGYQNWSEVAPSSLFLLSDPSSAAYEPAYLILVLVELVMDIFIFSYTILCLIHFFSKRSSTPRLMILLYVINLLAVLGSEFLFGSLASEYYDSDPRAITRTIVGAAIWVPYFLKSERVKETFNRRRKIRPEPQDEQQITYTPSTSSLTRN